METPHKVKRDIRISNVSRSAASSDIRRTPILSKSDLFDDVEFVSRRDLLIELLETVAQAPRSNIVRFSNAEQMFMVSDKSMIIETDLEYVGEFNGFLVLANSMFNSLQMFRNYKKTNQHGLINRTLCGAIENFCRRFNTMLQTRITQLETKSPDDDPLKVADEILTECSEYVTHFSNILNIIGPFANKAMSNQNTTKELLENFDLYIKELLSANEGADLIIDIYDEILQQWYLHVCRWMLDGEVDDIHSEFFIIKNEAASTWLDQYNLINSRRPSIIPESIAQRIFACGTYIHQLRASGSNMYAADENFEQLRVALNEMSMQCLYLETEQPKFYKIVDKIYMFLGRRCMHSLVQDHSLVENLAIIHKFVLLTDGPFAFALLNRLEPIRHKSAKPLLEDALLLEAQRCALKEAFEYNNGLFKNVNFWPLVQDLNSSTINIVATSKRLNYRISFAPSAHLERIVEPHLLDTIKLCQQRILSVRQCLFALNEAYIDDDATTIDHAMQFSEDLKTLRDNINLLTSRMQQFANALLVHFVDALDQALLVLIQTTNTKIADSKHSNESETSSPDLIANFFELDISELKKRMSLYIAKMAPLLFVVEVQPNVKKRTLTLDEEFELGTQMRRLSTVHQDIETMNDALSERYSFRTINETLTLDQSKTEAVPYVERISKNFGTIFDLIKKHLNTVEIYCQQMENEYHRREHQRNPQICFNNSSCQMSDDVVRLPSKIANLAIKTGINPKVLNNRDSFNSAVEEFLMALLEDGRSEFTELVSLIDMNSAYSANCLLLQEQNTYRRMSLTPAMRRLTMISSMNTYSSTPIDRRIEPSTMMSSLQSCTNKASARGREPCKVLNKVLESPLRSHQ